MASPHSAIDYRHEQPQARLASGLQHGRLQLRRRMAAIAPQMSEFNVDMKRLLRSIQPAAIAFGLLAANALLAVATPGSTRQEGVRSLRTEKLSNAPGRLFTIGTENSSPDDRSTVRDQGEGAFAYILTHAVRSE